MNKTFSQPAFYIFKKAWVIILFFFLVNGASAQTQQVLLYVDTFSSTNTSDVIFGSGVGSNSGNNDWIVNAQYTGQPTYPNTLSEDSVLSGLGHITGAPFSAYLHIHDQGQPSVADANWNPTHASDRFCYLASPFCTLGFNSVTFTFFWTGQGDSTAYGRVYYSTNGGATWTQTGQPKYYNQPDWKYEAITNANFANVSNLQFGFRWVNQGSDTTNDLSFGVDDIIAVGVYDSVNSPATITMDGFTSNSVCQSATDTMYFELNPPLCEGTYVINLSDSVGNFTHSTSLGSFSFDPTAIAPGNIFWNIPINIPPDLEGNCFRVTMTRISPPPVIHSDTSYCLIINHCGVTITTNNAPVMSDADTTCLKSAIDVYFNSTGNFDQNNVYYAQLSDSTGSFANPDTIGHLASSLAYPTKPGDVSGLIPSNIPPGCSYYIRIVSSSPGAAGSIIGPFCLTDCDVTTNSTIDLHACINYPHAKDTLTFNIKTNQWNQGATYDTCNNWTVELLDMMSFTPVNIGGLGVYHDSVSGNFKIILGPLDSLPPGVAPGTYYMRILSNCSNQPWNETGTVIRITIGAPNANPPYITSITGDSVYCNTTVMGLQVNPYDPNSNYYWNSNVINGGNPIEEESTPYFFINLVGAPPEDVIIYVRENNYGCFGPSSAPYNFIITADPKVKISGPPKVCLGDTAIFSATYFPATYYNWTAPPGVKVVLQSNTQVSMVFDSIGTFVIHENSVNICGSASGADTIRVSQLFNISAKPNKTVCYGDSVTLVGAVPPYPKTFISLDSSATSTPGGMFNILAHDDIIIDSFAVSFRAIAGSCPVSIYTRAGSYRGYEQSVGAWSGELINRSVPVSHHAFTKTVIPFELNKHIAAGDTTAFYITSTSTTIGLAYGNGIGFQQGIVYKRDGVIDFIQGTQNDYPFGIPNGPEVLNLTIYYRTLSGLHYLWNTGATTDTISFIPTQTTLYDVKVYDTSGCRNFDTVLVTVDTLPHVYAGPDTLLCPNSNYLMLATASPSATLNWNPATGLSQPTALNPVLNSTQTTNYILTATGEGGCTKSDSVLISVYPLSVNAGPDTTLCADETYVMQGLASTDNFSWFPAIGLSAVNILNPVFSYNQSNQYYLTVQDAEGCTLTDTVLITVAYCDVYIKTPDAFTPNGDGVNDFFTVFGKYISDYHIRIYNRWGEEVYSSSNVNELNDLSRGWDGTYKGKLQDVGTFVYYIEAKDLNGHNVFRKGNVTLIR